MRRIGRDANAAERGMQLLRENPDLLARVAKNLYGADRGLAGTQLEEAWRSLTDEEREHHTEDAIARTEKHAAEYVPSAPPPDDDPDPGERRIA